ncbi:MAG: photosynthetic complex assembly protein PuhC [Betaproteobacteria bacterium HGW-Betaproteobacteria-3]|jgi:putative photosynthetic complex assembly protein|nr:MAG: photosynthetic complex assembly protein PuhC [Betaproteobacteria bacterium HGW-Betaproteobacteria-3]
MSQSHAHDNIGVPRPALLAMGALAMVALVGASWVRLSGVDIRAPDAVVAQERALRFEDRPDGAVAVVDPKTGKTVDTVTGQAGFVRGTLRGLARERKRMGLGAEQPFVLMGRADGRLTLKDPATGRVVDLESFGPVNAGVFARMLASPAQN